MMYSNYRTTAQQTPAFAARQAEGAEALQPFSLPTGERFSLQWQLSLDTLIDELERLPGMTELRFLKVGAMLQEISRQLLAIGAGTDKVAAMMSGDEAVKIIRTMEQLLDGLELDFIAANRAAGLVENLLSGIFDELHAMARLMESFKGHVGNLRMLKLLTNIQGASLTERGIGFRTLANDIGALAQNINVKSNAILTRIGTLNAELLKGRAMVAGLEVTQKQLNDKMVGAVRAKIALVAEIHEKCSAAARELSSHSGELSRNVGSVVVALQFQDITRQQMEHAREALGEVRQRFSAAKTSGDAGMVQEELTDICRLQVAQLTNSADELVAAVKGIAASLQGVQREAAEASARVHGIFLQTESGERSSLVDIEAGLTSLVNAFAENMAVRESLAAIMTATTTAMGDITGFAGEIDFLGSEIRLISLNAIIKAAQVGRDGAAFNVIAETVKQQSDDICRQAAMINTTIQAVVGHVADLQRETADKGENTFSLRAEELTLIVAELKDFIAEAGRQLRETDHAADSLAGTVAAATASLASQDLVATVQNELLSRTRRLSAGLPASRQQVSRSGGIKDTALRYTMDSERAVHQEFLGRDARSDWYGPGETGVPGALTNNGDHFAGNVELF